MEAYRSQRSIKVATGPSGRRIQVIKGAVLFIGVDALEVSASLSFAVFCD
jgi:hypothetical protein